MKKWEMLCSKLNKIEKLWLYCFMIFCYSKVNGIKGPAVLASQIHRFIVSLLHIMLFHMISALKERKNEKKRNKHGYRKNLYNIGSTNFWQRTSKHMSVSMGKGVDRMFKTMAWNKERKKECCNKVWSPKTYVAAENECKKARERFIRKFLYQSLSKDRWASC